MGMKVGDLFFELGVTGSEKSVGAIAGVKSGVKDAASASLAFKAALVGAFYAVQRLFSASGQVGTDLKNFSSLVDVSAQTLQEYQFAARKVGVSNQEMERTFLNLQQTMTKTLRGEGAPSGLARVAEIVGDLTQEDVWEWKNDPTKLIQVLQQYAQLEKDAGLRNDVLGSFGLGDNMKAALVRNAFRPEIMAQAPKYSEREIKSLDRANAAWSELGNTIEMTFGRFNASHGEKLVADITKIVKSILDLSNAFIRLSDKAKLFDKLTMVFEGWSLIFKELTRLIDDIPTIFTTLFENLGIPKDAIEGAIEGLGNILGKGLIDFVPDAATDKVGSALYNPYSHDKLQKPENPTKSNIKPEPIKAPGVLILKPESIAKPPRPSSLVTPLPNGKNPPDSGNTTINIDQTMNFSHPGINPGATADSVKKAAKAAYQQSSARSQGS